MARPFWCLSAFFIEAGGRRHPRHHSRAAEAVPAVVGRGRDIAKSDCGCGDRLSSISPAQSDTLETNFQVQHKPSSTLKSPRWQSCVSIVI